VHGFSQARQDAKGLIPGKCSYSTLEEYCYQELQLDIDDSRVKFRPESGNGAHRIKIKMTHTTIVRENNYNLL
jgi:hypothetical protein